MDYVQEYRGSHVFLDDGQPYEVTDVMVKASNNFCYTKIQYRFRNMLTDVYKEDTRRYKLRRFKPEEREYDVTKCTDEPPTLHLEEGLGELSVPVSESVAGQWLWKALQRTPDRPAVVILQVLKNPSPKKGEQRVFCRIIGAYLRRWC
jgi:hypothetical protein